MPSADTLRRMSIGSADIDSPRESDLLTVAEIADQYRITQRSVQRWIREGKLKAVRLPGGRAYRVRRSDLDAAIEASA